MKRGQSAQATETPDRAGDTNDLVRMVSVLAHDVATLDSMIRKHRPRLERAGKAPNPERELALDQWTRIRARAVEVVNRAQDTLEKVKQHRTE
jgi:hypothetical protein